MVRAYSGGGRKARKGTAMSKESEGREQVLSPYPPPAPPPPSAPLPPPAPVPRATEAPAPLLPLLVAEDHQLVEDVGGEGLWSCSWPPPAQHRPSRSTGGRARPTRARSVAGWLAVGGGQERAGQLWCFVARCIIGNHLLFAAVGMGMAVGAQIPWFHVVPSEPAEIEPAERESDCLLTAGSSSNGAREADEQIEKRTGPTSKRLQWGRCNRSRPMASEHVEGTKPPMSTADLPQSRARVAIMLVEQSGKVYPATTNIRKPASEPGPQRSKRHRGGVFNPPVPGQEKSAGLRDRSG